MKELIIYPNASKGGITSVIRGRAAASPHTRFDVVFLEDRGGSQAFSDLSNVRMSIIPRGRAEPAIEYLVNTHSYRTVSVLSYPSIVKRIAGSVHHLRYEFHSSDMEVNSREVNSLELDLVDEFTAPTSFMVTSIEAVLPAHQRRKLRVLPNLVDSTIFSPTGPSDFYNEDAPAADAGIPLVWVGRFDDGKGYKHFLRALRALPEQYFGIVVVSLEKDPNRTSSFFNECAAMGVTERVHLYLNQPHSEMARLYRWAAERGGQAISTSLLESFGYFVAEATECGLPVIAFDLPVWQEHKNKDLITRVTVGSVTSLVQSIQTMTCSKYHRPTINYKS